MKKPIFISYKRVDEGRVLSIKDRIEAETGASCWIDADGIESDAQFMSVIIEAIKDCDIFLFFYSSSHLNNNGSDWPARELNFAEKKKKRIVLIRLDDAELTDELLFKYDLKQQIFARKEVSMQKLIRDINKWLGIARKDSTSNKTQSSDDSPKFNHSEAGNISNDISIAFITNDNFYFCFGETGQKLKIPMSSFRDKDGKMLSVDGILDKIDSLRISGFNGCKEKMSVYKFSKSFPSLLKSAVKIFILHTDCLESYLNAMDVIEDYKDVLPIRIIPENQIAAFGSVARNAWREAYYAYGYKSGVLDVNTGDGVIEIGEYRTNVGYVSPSIKDIIKGCVIQFSILDGLVKDLLFLTTTIYEYRLILIEDDRVRDVLQMSYGKYVTIPTKFSHKLCIESPQTAMIEIEGVPVTSDISGYFKEITTILYDSNGDVLIEGKKEHKDVCMHISTLIRNCPRKRI